VMDAGTCTGNRPPGCGNPLVHRPEMAAVSPLSDFERSDILIQLAEAKGITQLGVARSRDGSLARLSK
jgi:hypothetical protein